MVVVWDLPFFSASAASSGESDLVADSRTRCRSNQRITGAPLKIANRNAVSAASAMRIEM